MKFICTILSVILLSCFVNTASATLYTADTSGSYSNISTWQGGVAPPANLSTSDTVIITNGAVVTLDRTLVVYGMLQLIGNSELTLNNYDLAIESSGRLIFAGNSGLGSTNTSNVTIKTPAVSPAIAFMNGRNTVKNFAVEMDSSIYTVKLAGDLKVTGELKLIEGKIDVQDNKLSLIAGGIISGGFPISYVVATGRGVLAQDVEENTTKVYPVGTNGFYAPIIIEGNTGHKPGQASVSVVEGVVSGGDNGYSISNTKPVVGITWFANTTSNTINADVTLSWFAPEEKNGFNRNACFVSSNYGGWDSDSATAATPNSLGYYSQKRENLTRLFAFTVFDNSGAVGVENVTVKESIRIYPNPVRDVLHVQATGTMQVYNMTGQMVLQKTLQQGDNQIDVSNLPGGTYQLIVNGEEVYKLRFVKQ